MGYGQNFAMRTKFAIKTQLCDTDTILHMTSKTGDVQVYECVCGENELSMSRTMYERVYAIMVSCGMSICVHAYLCKAITMVFCGTVGCNRYRRCVCV